MTITRSAPVRAAIIFTVVVLLAIVLFATGVGASSPDAVGETITHRVVAGDTLWDIAAGHTADGGDVRRTVFEIKQHNGIGSVIVHSDIYWDHFREQIKSTVAGMEPRRVSLPPVIGTALAAFREIEGIDIASVRERLCDTAREAFGC